jgi:hypothetical protein
MAPKIIIRTDEMTMLAGSEFRMRNSMSMVSRMLNLRRTVNIGSERDFVDLRPVNILARYNRGNGNNFLGISRENRGNETIRKPRRMYKIRIAETICPIPRTVGAGK